MLTWLLASLVSKLISPIFGTCGGLFSGQEGERVGEASWNFTRIILEQVSQPWDS